LWRKRWVQAMLFIVTYTGGIMMYKAYRIGDSYSIHYRDIMNLNKVMRYSDIIKAFGSAKNNYDSFRLALKL
jgi:hypothetical protein